jgi:hypothetical protein
VVVRVAIEQKGGANPYFSVSTGAKIGILCEVAKDFVEKFIFSSLALRFYLLNSAFFTLFPVLFS